MKKLITFLLAMMMVLSLAACGGNDDPDPSGSGTGQQGSEQTGQPSNSGGQSNNPNGEIDAEKWLDYLTDTYGLSFTQNDREYWDDYYPASITEDDADEAKTSVFKFEDMPMDMQNVLVGQMFTASAALSGNNNLDPASGAVIGEANDLYFYGDSDPSPTKAWNYTYNNAQYNISIALSSSKKVEMTVTAYKGGRAESGKVKQAGDTASYGAYNGQPIEWLALAVDLENEKALLVTKDCICIRQFHESDDTTGLSWETSDIRVWLNGEFYDTAFQTEQKAMLLETTVITPPNSESGAAGGNDTTDKVFLLSEQEVKQYFTSDEAMAAQCQGEDCSWWTRTPGNDNSGYVCTYTDGGLYMTGNTAYSTGVAVRPAIWISLSNEAATENKN